MKISKLVPVFCLALGLALATPFTAAATGNTETGQQITNGWSADKKSYYQNGSKLTGVCQIDGTYYYFNSTGTLVTGKDGKTIINNCYYYIRSNGTLLRNGWATSSGGYRYYAGDNAKLYTNKAVRIGANIYCFNEKAVMHKNGLKKVNGKTYLLRADGRAYVGKKSYKGDIYVLGTDGAMQTGLIKHTNGKFYYADTVTGIVKTGFFKVGGKAYYARKSGALRTGWVKYNGTRFYFNPSNGAMKTGWLKRDGKYYYYTPKGKIKTGWITTKGKTYYSAKSGSSKGARITGIQWLNQKRYFFNKKGVLKTGWVTKSGKKYYMNSKGVITTGWRKIKNKWYYFQFSGVMQTGWLVHNGKFYYLDPKTGAMATGNKKINGSTYNFGSNGTYSAGSLSGSWTIKVNRAANVVTVYKGSTPIKAFLCSTGLNNATPLGTFRVLDKLYMHELNGPTWGYYCSHITSDILFHSIPAPSTSRSGVPSYKFNMLGQQASQGCIRLAMGDAYWLYTTVPVGSTVVVYDDAKYPGPLGRPTATKMSTSPTYYYDPTDPNRTNNKTPN